MAADRRTIHNVSLRSVGPVGPVGPLGLPHKKWNKPFANIPVEFLNRFPGSAD